MSKKIRKIFTYLLLTVLTVVGLGNVVNVSAEAAEPESRTTDVVIHKIETDAGVKDMTLDQLAKGITQGSDAWNTQFGADAEPLQGVSFTYYSVTADQLETLTAGDYDTVAKVDVLLGEGTGTETLETNANGEVTISDLADGNYWIVENTKGTIASSAAVPFALTLPFTNLSGNGYLETINVYPKNILENVPVNPEKTVNESNVAIGDTNTWTISQVIPEGIEDYKTFTFVDEIDSRLDWLGNVNVSAEDVTFVDGDYTVNYVAAPEGTDGKLINHTISGTLTVVFTEQGRKNLANANGSVVITFDTKVNDSAVMGEPIENNVQVDFDNGHGHTGKNTPAEVPSVHTGGKKFEKEDSANNLLLDGAEFKIKNAAGDFVIIGTDGAVTFGAEADAEVFTSAKDTGAFEVRGLPYEDYVLVETKAPDGYALPTDPNTSFTVNADSYKDAAVLKIDNKEITIPQTGGIGTAIFTMIGAALMIFATVYYKRTSNA